MQRHRHGLSANPSLLTIIAHARSGALDHAWGLLRDAGLDRINDDPAVLSVVGRLLKDKALRAHGPARQQLFVEAASAYARAAEIGGTTYPLINAATLSLLAKQNERAQSLARLIMQQAQSAGDDADTPYYRAATRAEALLLLGQADQAKAALAEAMLSAPQAYEDHASTLRQFALIIDELGGDKTWLDSYRPPRCLHYAGHMATGAVPGETGRQIRAALKEEKIGFGYGALAAGADILIAEALLEEGAELHLLLPAAPARFREASVARSGGDWLERYDDILKSANTIRAVGDGSVPSSPLALQLAAEVAMGCAVMQSNVLMTEAVQLVILERNASAQPQTGSSEWACAAWGKTGRRQKVLVTPRIGAGAETYRVSESGEPRLLRAMLRIEWSGANTSLLSREIIPRLTDIFAGEPKPSVRPRWTDDALLTGFDTPAQAARIASSAIAALAGVADLRVAGHYGLAQQVEDPFGGAPLLIGSVVTLPAQITLSTPPGAVHLTEDFAAALNAGPPMMRPSVEYVGELSGADEGETIRLFALAQ